MAVYKVPQDVEADDKLIGPLSPRQALYAGIVAISIGLIFLLAQQLGMFVASIALAALSPVILIFGALALPLRKDQPMETYLIALLRFYLKPHERLWQPDGSTNLVEITAPKVVEELRTKGLNEEQARDKLDYLAQLMDTRGWAARGVSPMQPQMQPPILVADSDTSNDVLDSQAPLSQNFGHMIDQKYIEQKEAAVKMMQQAQTGTFQPNTAEPARVIPPQPRDDTSAPSFDPYPKAMHQHVVSPEGEKPHTPRKTRASHKKPPKDFHLAEPISQPQSGFSRVSSDTMNLAYNTDNLSISAIANEAHRLEQKHGGEDEEVVISLR